MIDVMIIAHNEALNLPHCLDALQGWTRKVFVIDSGSTDGTQNIVRSFGAEVIEHEWEGYARQKNWGLKNLPLETDWILILDADEVITKDVKERLMGIAGRPVSEVHENGFFINRLTYFMGGAIRHCGFFPSWNLRFFKRGKALYEDRLVHEHMIVSDPVGYINEAMIHDDRRGLEHYVAKHNRYSTLEAQAIFEEMQSNQDGATESHLSPQSRFRRWAKRTIIPRIPFPGLLRFMYMYICRLGVLDGRAGLEFCRFISMYDAMVALKLRDLKRQSQHQPKFASPRIVPQSGLAVPEGRESVESHSGRASTTSSLRLNQ